tara:strand:- start:96 stop:599 length:504 start_codon:yes stop_codon:yes gene_type:complete
MKKIEDQSKIEYLFEGGLWATRYIIILAVIFSIISAITLFLYGSYEVIHSIQEALKIPGEHSLLVAGIISAVDLYLIGVVLMIFGFGIYELFISKIDIAREDKDISILEIKDLDELKNKIIKVIIMVLIVSFFQRVLKMDYETPLDMLYFALSIFALSFGVYLIKKH